MNLMFRNVSVSYRGKTVVGNASFSVERVALQPLLDETARERPLCSVV